MSLLDPDNPEFPAALAVFLRRAGKLDDALKAADRSIALAHDESAGYVIRGTVLFQMRKYKEALELSKKAIELDPDELPAWELRSRALWGLGRKDAALKAADNAVRLSPNNAKPLHPPILPLQLRNTLLDGHGPPPGGS